MENNYSTLIDEFENELRETKGQNEEKIISL